MIEILCEVSMQQTLFSAIVAVEGLGAETAHVVSPRYTTSACAYRLCIRDSVC